MIQIAEVKRDKPVDFDKEVLPILRKNCVACHNASTAEAKLVVESAQAMLKGGDSGPAIIAVATVMSIPVLIGLGARWSARSEIQQLQSTNAALRMENDSYKVATGELAQLFNACFLPKPVVGVKTADGSKIVERLLRLGPGLALSRRRDRANADRAARGGCPRVRRQRRRGTRQEPRHLGPRRGRRGSLPRPDGHRP